MIVVLILAVVIGLALGLLGGGGSILTVPVLVYAAGLPPHEAIATSLLVVGATSAAALVPHARAGRVRFRTGLVFGATAMVGAFAAGRLAHFVPGTVLLGGFALMMLATAYAMLRKNKSNDSPDAAPETKGDLPIKKVVVEGLVVGAVTGLVGAGGGFLVVPVLVLLGGMPMRVAVGTSLLVIAMKSFAGFFGYIGHVDIDVPLALGVTALAITGSMLGAVFAQRIPQALLRRAFGVLVLVMGTFVLVQQFVSPS